MSYNFVVHMNPLGIAEQAVMVTAGPERRIQVQELGMLADCKLGIAELAAGRVVVGYNLSTAVRTVAGPVAAAEVHIPVAGIADTFDLPSGQLEAELLCRTAAAVEHQADELQMRKRQYCQVFLIVHLLEH